MPPQTLPTQPGQPGGSSTSRNRPGNRAQTASASQTSRRANSGRMDGDTGTPPDRPALVKTGGGWAENSQEI
jgi:hypothetical protein